MEDNSRSQPPDNVIISRRKFLQLAGAAGASLLAACATDASSSQPTVAPTEAGSNNPPAQPNTLPTSAAETGSHNIKGPTAVSGARPGATTEVPTNALDTQTAVPAQKSPTAVTTPTSGAPTAAEVPTAQQNAADVATPSPDTLSIPEFDDKEGRIVVSSVRNPMDAQVGHTVEIRYKVDPKEINLRDAKAIAQSQVLKDMSANMAQYVVNLLESELGLDKGILSPGPNDHIDVTLGNFTRNIDAILAKQPPIKKEDQGADSYDWKKTDVASRYREPKETEGIFFNEDDPSIAANGGVVAEVVIWKRKGAAPVIGSKGNPEEEGRRFKEVIGTLSREAAKMAGYVTDKGQLDPSWFAGHDRWLNDMSNWVVPTPTATT